MKVNIYETVEVTDEDRKRVAAILGQKNATREELKAFIWQHGAKWQSALSTDEEVEAATDALFQGDEANVNDEEDLIGAEDPVAPEVRAQIAANDAKYEAALAKAQANLREAEDLI